MMHLLVDCGVLVFATGVRQQALAVPRARDVGGFGSVVARKSSVVEVLYRGDEEPGSGEKASPVTHA